MNSPRIVHLYVSAGHNYFGHHEQPPGEHETVEKAEVNCLAGRGIEGDRFFDYKADYKGQITFFAEEIFEALCGQLCVHDKSAAVLRRNVITRGVDLTTLYDREFEVQGVRFLGMGECKPCYWMDRAFGPGAENALKGRGGLRAKILSSGRLAVDVAVPQSAGAR
ncbi:molybdenum cofactor biosysynthesis protein [Nibricoccus aquaticus]|uniref:Molybdenum cofactor biosysynthesis protein n=1 Tax=Nibricoccus aquaticus TaxID=2576891 RepID=A0A290Q907_9BACT|nr:molybdenum cofactor biosysynthesis protein [Nibricoccus aquaticus]ATC64994.1 molybdenum cofactor biosysynthesis protein [Nibricoccus aquaticus]